VRIAAFHLKQIIANFISTIIGKYRHQHQQNSLFENIGKALWPLSPPIIQ
jgi:hypothetical protein